MNPWAELFAAISMFAVVGFCVAAWFWVVDTRDLRRLRHLTRFRLLTLFVVTTLAAFTFGFLKATGQFQTTRDLGGLAQASVPAAIMGVGLWFLSAAWGHFRELFSTKRAKQLPDVMSNQE